MTISSRCEVYANVLLDFSLKENGEKGVIASRNELREFNDLLLSDIDIKTLLESKSSTIESKLEIAKVICKGKSISFSSIIKTIIENDDIKGIKIIIRKFDELIAIKLNVCIIDITTFVELDDTIRDMIKAKAERELGLKAILNEKIDKNIIGGIIMSVNGKCIDASMITQLNRARSVLKAS